jgi:hypothetical protein
VRAKVRANGQSHDFNGDYRTLKFSGRIDYRSKWTERKMSPSAFSASYRYNSDLVNWRGEGNPLQYA